MKRYSNRDLLLRMTINKSVNITSVPHEVLLKILIRLPTLKSAVQCITVCKRWFSIISHPNFSATFMSHIHTSKPPLRLIFGSTFVFGNQPIRIRPPQRQTSLPLPIAGLVDSFPWFRKFFNHDSTLLAVSNDLLLVQMSELFELYFICNPITGQSLMLPRPPTIQSRSMHLTKTELVVEPNNNNTNNNQLTRFRVMQIYRLKAGGDTTYAVKEFSSETGLWRVITTRNKFGLVSFSPDDVVASNGRLYGINLKLKKMFVMDLFGAQKVVEFKLPVHALVYSVEPDALVVSKDEHDALVSKDDNDDDHNNDVYQLKFGLVQGRPRLLLLLRVDSTHLSLRVWDLIYDDNSNNGKPSWLLVQEVEFEVADVDVYGKVSVVAFHPSQGDQIFILHNRSLYLYDMKIDDEIKVAEIHYHHSYGNGQIVPEFHIFPFVPPVRPTLI